MINYQLMSLAILTGIVILAQSYSVKAYTVNCYNNQYGRMECHGTYDNDVGRD